MPLVEDLAKTHAKVLERLLIEDESVLRLDEREVTDAIREALDMFNIVAPLSKVFEVVGTGSKKRYVLNDDVTDWVKTLSQVRAVHEVYFPGTDSEEVKTLRKEQWEQKISVDDDDVLMVYHAISSGLTLRVDWTTYATIKDLDGASTTTIPERYTEAFYLFAVSTGAMYVAQKAARMKQSSFGSDLSSLEELHSRWLDISRLKKRQAEERLGSIRGAATSAGTSAGWPTKTRWGWGNRISH